jgi:hypothetical protein
MINVTRENILPFFATDGCNRMVCYLNNIIHPIKEKGAPRHNWLRMECIETPILVEITLEKGNPRGHVSISYLDALDLLCPPSVIRTQCT